MVNNPIVAIIKSIAEISLLKFNHLIHSPLVNAMVCSSCDPSGKPFIVLIQHIRHLIEHVLEGQLRLPLWSWTDVVLTTKISWEFYE